MDEPGIAFHAGRSEFEPTPLTFRIYVRIGIRINEIRIRIWLSLFFNGEEHHEETALLRGPDKVVNGV